MGSGFGVGLKVWLEIGLKVGLRVEHHYTPIHIMRPTRQPARQSRARLARDICPAPAHACAHRARPMRQCRRHELGLERPYKNRGARGVCGRTYASKRWKYVLGHGNTVARLAPRCHTSPQRHVTMAPGHGVCMCISVPT